MHRHAAATESLTQSVNIFSPALYKIELTVLVSYSGTLNESSTMNKPRLLLYIAPEARAITDETLVSRVNDILTFDSRALAKDPVLLL